MPNQSGNVAGGQGNKGAGTPPPLPAAGGGNPAPGGGRVTSFNSMDDVRSFFSDHSADHTHVSKLNADLESRGGNAFSDDMLPRFKNSGDVARSRGLLNASDAFEGEKGHAIEKVRNQIEGYEDIRRDFEDAVKEAGEGRAGSRINRISDKMKQKLTRDAEKTYRNLDKLEESHVKAKQRLTEEKLETRAKIIEEYSKENEKLLKEKLAAAPNSTEAKAAQTKIDNLLRKKEALLDKFDEYVGKHRDVHDDVLREVEYVRKDIESVTGIRPPAKAVAAVEAAAAKTAETTLAETEKAAAGKPGIMSYIGIVAGPAAALHGGASLINDMQDKDASLPSMAIHAAESALGATLGIWSLKKIFGGNGAAKLLENTAGHMRA